MTATPGGTTATTTTGPPPEVSVVVPTYRRPEQLQRLLAGLDAQTLPPDRFEVVVADDGSPEPPDPGTHAYTVTVVRQDDDGFRAAAARNLGAAAARGAVIAFLDQDCVPAADYLERVGAAAVDPWALVVGHRRHTELDGWSSAEVRGWVDGSGPAPREEPEPQWLLDGYVRTDDLRQPDDRSYQLVISAVLSVNRALFERLGGFDGSFRGYGGEDWELAHRALVAGADLRWLRDAVAWHDGPDLAGRAVDLARTKNAETLALAGRIPDADVRGVGLVWRRPDVVVRLDATGAAVAAVAHVVACLESMLEGTDAQVWLATGDDAAGRDLAAEVMTAVQDPRVHVGSPGAEVLASARFVVDCGAVVLDGATLRSVCAGAPVYAPGFRVARLRDENRRARGCAVPPDAPLPDGVSVSAPGDDLVLERLWQGRLRSR